MAVLAPTAGSTLQNSLSLIARWTRPEGWPGQDGFATLSVLLSRNQNTEWDPTRFDTAPDPDPYSHRLHGGPDCQFPKSSALNHAEVRGRWGRLNVLDELSDRLCGPNAGGADGT
jgi:hypothetical protein